MKKLLLIINFLFTILFLTSCSGHFFNPRYYYNKNGSQESEQTPPPDIDIGGGGEDVPEDQDPFKNGEWNDIDYKFDGDKILEFLFAASFDGKNVPVYTFFKDGTQWTLSDASMAENKYNAKDGVNKAQGYDITGGSFYRYDYKNPLVAADSAYNQSERMERFLFYRIVGKAVIVPLNNYLIAVDKYSKLVFAYGKITKTGSAMGQAYPTAFEAVELHGDKRPFYEYDPIGFMSYDETQDKMTLTLYREYQEEMAMDANAFFPKIHDSTRDIAGYKDKESAGRSPYYYVNVDDIAPETILDQLKGKTYSIRSGLTLYTYKFSDDGKSVQIIKEHFYNGTTFDQKFEFSKVTGATSVQYGDMIITGLESYVKVKDNVNNVAAELDYVDPGPEFIYRVRGKVFDAEDKSYSYKFNIDGKTIEYYENGQFVRYYAFVQQDASDRAIYKEERSGSFAYWGLRLDVHNGTKDGVLYWSSGAGDTPGLTSSSGVSSYPGYLNVDESVIEFFVDEVANKVYAYRDYEGTPGDGRSLKTFEYKFSSDGKTITYTEEISKQESTSITYTLVKDNGKEAIYKDNSGTQYTFTLQSSARDLLKNGDPAGVLGFRDKGAYFLDVVVNTTYYSMDGTYKYEFDGSGNLTYTYPSGEKATFTITDKYGSSQADYTKAAYIEDGALLFKYWALKLSANGTMIQMSTGALATASHILNSAAYGYDAYLTGKDGAEIDRFMSVVAGETYKMRVQGNVALMQYYTFSKAGNYITHVITNTQTGKEVSSNMYYNYKAIDKQFNGQYEQMTPKQNKKFTIQNSDNELLMDNVIVGYKNYTDPYEFMSRVAGKTYITDDGSKKYVFSPNGDYFDFYENGNKKNTFKYDSYNGNVGTYTTGGWFGTEVTITLSDYQGIKDGQIQEGSITAHVYVAPKFTDNVKSKVYKFRDYSEYSTSSPLPEGYKPTGKSLVLYSYSFDDTGKKLTYKEETWNAETKEIVYTLSSETESMGTYTSASGDIKVSIQGSPDILYKVQDTARSVSVEVGRTSFVDYGPIFTDRVRGAKFEKGNVSYTFEPDGTKFILKDGSTTMTFVLARYNNDIAECNNAVYEYQEESTIFKYRWVELSDPNTIKTSTSGFTIGAPGSTMGFEATRQ